MVARDGGAHRRLGQTVVFQHLSLTGGVAGAVAAHGRKQEGIATERFDAVHDRLDDGLDVGDAAAAAANGDALARLDLGGDFRLLELLGDGLGNVVHARGLGLLPYRHHAGQGDLQTAGDIDVDALDHGMHSLVFEWGRAGFKGERGASIPRPTEPAAGRPRGLWRTG